MTLAEFTLLHALIALLSGAIGGLLAVGFMVWLFKRYKPRGRS